MLTDRSGLVNSFGTEKEPAWPVEGPEGSEEYIGGVWIYWRKALVIFFFPMPPNSCSGPAHSHNSADLERLFSKHGAPSRRK